MQFFSLSKKLIYNKIVFGGGNMNTTNQSKQTVVSEKEVQEFLQANKDIVAQEIICGLCM